LWGGGGKIGFYNRLCFYRRPKFCRTAKLASCIVDARAAVKLVLHPFTLLSPPQVFLAGNSVAIFASTYLDASI